MISNTLAIAWKDLRIILKDKGALAIFFLMPLLLATMMGLAFGNVGSAGTAEAKIEVATLLVNLDQGTYGQMVADGLKAAPVLKIEELADAAQADQQVADGKAAEAVIIPADLTSKIDAAEPVQIVVIKDPTQKEAAGIVTGVVNQAMAEVDLVGELRYGIHAVTAQQPGYDQAPPELIKAVEAQTLGVIWSQVQSMRQHPLIAVKSETLEGKQVEEEPWNPITYYVPGFTVAFAFFLIGAMAGELHQEKEQGTFRRLLSSPIPKQAIIAGKVVAYMAVVFLQVVLLATVGYAVFKMPLGSSPLGLALLTLGLALAAASLGMLIGTLTRNSKQAQQVGTVVGFVLLILGGTTFPYFRGTGTMAILSRLTPNSWGIEGYMGMLADEWGMAQVWPNIVMLLGFAAVFFAIAVWRFRYE
jgi:ABC-2 type transport system permease protein